ncbi:MAG: DegT/DnrJ/EryC1/StrS family aminotransferase [Candidatus Bathyarchaeota archaeon]|nr:DegT/DnrJ/EryC1/StrS family aminotransferase [Candidatus Bathyarchaeota archaeon]
MKYKVPFVNYPEHYRRIWNEVISAISNALSKGDLILRDDVKQFERNMADFIGVKHAIGLNSGTDALYISLKAVGIEAGDEVITVAHTFVATIATIVQCGAKPILVDIGEDMNMNVDEVESKINTKTKAIIPVDLNGRLCNMEKLMKIAKKHDVLIIEDSAQALGAMFDGKKAGAFGLTGCFSFYPAKILGAAGDAGLLTTDDDKIAEKVYLLRDHGVQRSTGETLFYGINSRLDNVQAAILNVKFRYLNKWIERRRKLAQLYHRRLSNIPDLKLPPPPSNNGHFYDVYQNYVIRSKKRDQLVTHLRESGVEVLISWPKPLQHHKALGLSRFHLPTTEQVSNEVLSLPMYPELREEDVNYVADVIQDFYDR